MTIIFYTKQILEALQFLHENQIIHRDIKPHNALVDGKENVKLIDFGFSLHLSKVGNEIPQTMTYCGTQHYMAPEILNGELYSCSVDIWSLGITVIEMVKGKIPQSVNPNAFIAEIIKTRTVKYELPDSLKHPKNLEFLINKMLHPDGYKRSSATELLNEFCVFPDHLY